MANRTPSRNRLGEKVDVRRSGKSTSRSPVPNGRKQQVPQLATGYTSEGVKDHDIFNLPGSDWSLLGLLMIVATMVRLFRISQPTSVVFDEVQYVSRNNI
jgi:dolichyl-phosphate-mannose-protein mannosyltransferase